MDFTSLTRRDIDRLTQLINERDALNARLAEITKALGGGSNVGGGLVAQKTRKAGKPPAKVKIGKRRGGLKDSILSILKDAPASGVSVETMAGLLKRKPAVLHTWFYTTGKPIKGIQKVGRGIYAWKASAPEAG
jgi:hypothetical protein